MRKVFVIMLTILLIPCFALAEITEGTYKLGKSKDLVISRAPSKGTVFNVNIDVGVKMCSGQFKGRGSMNGEILVAQENDSGTICTIMIEPTKKGLKISESHDCMGWHGPACDFTGTYTYKKKK